MAGTAAGFPSRHGGPVGTHRSHGHPIGKGAELDRLLAELMGRETGVNQGKGGSMHLSDFSIGSLGETSIVGSGIPVAAGAALGSKMQGDDRVTLCFFGDGASNQGTFHEALNLAAIWSLPVVYVCENNAYGELTAASYAVAVENVSSRAVAYGMPGATVDGQDVLAVYEAVNEAVSRARRGGGGHHQRCREPTRVPIIVELRRDLDRHVPPRTRDPVACDLHCGRAWPQTWQGGSVGAPDPHQVIDEVTVDCYRDDKAASAFAVVVEECLDGRSVPARVVGFATELTAVEHMGDRRGVVVGIRDGGRRHRVALCDVEVDAAAHPNRPC